VVAVTVRGDTADVTSLQPLSDAELPLRLAEPAHDVAPVTAQLTVKGTPVKGAAGTTASGKLFGVGPPPPPPHPVPVSVTPVATRSVPPATSRRPLASVLMSQVVCCVVVRWMVTWALAMPETMRASAGTSEARRRIATDIDIPA